MTTFEAIIALIEEDVRCDIHGDLYGHERVAEHLADYIDGYVKRIEQLETALRYVDDNMVGDDYGNWQMLPDFRYGVIHAALEEKKCD